ncbi:MAG TPA: alpha/beta hydrolase [Candidatus Aquilonibacter sp.]|nr:alpha/beta hydrolase [Candidatus Aquilonibacter sp.]
METQEQPVVLIHGLWMTPLCWENWEKRYAAQGYRVINKGWPGLDGDINELRRDPSPIAGLGITEIVDHYESIIRALEVPPIIIGHSFGGLIAQVLLDRGLGSAGVAISTAPIRGIIFLPFSTLRVSAPALSNPANDHRAIPLTPEQFHYAFTNTLSEEESLAVYNRYAVPGPDHLLFQAALANFNPHAATTVNVHNDNRAPLLLIAGDWDHISPPAVVKATHRLYRHSKAITEYKEFPGRSHYILGLPGWEEVADYSAGWAIGRSSPQSSAAAGA